MKIVIALAVVLALAAAGRWALTPGCRLPRHRVRHTRLRLHLRLHPGRGYATCFELWLRWGRLAAFRRSGRIRPSLSAWQRMRHAAGAFGAGGPGAVPAPAGGAAGGAPAADGPAPHLQDRPARQRRAALSGAGDLHHHQGRRVRPHLRRPRRHRAGARVQPPIHRQRALHVLLVAAAGLRGPGGGDPPRRRVRPGRLPEGRRGRHLLVGQGLATTCGPTSTPPPWPART